LEFPVTLCGGGMDIFWNYTISKSLYLSVALLALMVFLMPVVILKKKQPKKKVWIGHDFLNIWST